MMRPSITARSDTLATEIPLIEESVSTASVSTESEVELCSESSVLEIEADEHALWLSVWSNVVWQQR